MPQRSMTDIASDLGERETLREYAQRTREHNRRRLTIRVALYHLQTGRRARSKGENR